MVISGIPAKAQLFNGSICEGRPSMQQALSKPRQQNQLPGEISAASPLFLRAVNWRTKREAKERDIVIAINTGIITCFSGKGDFKWQVTDGPTWPLGDSSASIRHFDLDGRRSDERGNHNSLYSQLLIVGESRVSLTSREGEMLASAYLPKPSISKPVIGDFDGDGITDVLILTEDAILGYRVEAVSSPNGLLLALIILAVAAVLIFLLSLKSDFIVVDGIQQVNSNKRLYTLVRSTDDAHID